jgi:hypothetical protein
MAKTGQYGTVMLTRNELLTLDKADSILREAWDSIPKDVGEKDSRRKRHDDLMDAIQTLSKVRVHCAMVQE